MNFKKLRILGLVVLLVSIFMITVVVIPTYYANNLNISTFDDVSISTSVHTVEEKSEGVANTN